MSEEENDTSHAWGHQQELDYRRWEEELSNDPAYARWSNERDFETRKHHAMKPRKSAGTDFKRLPPGNHVAICNMVADIGLQQGSQRYPDPKYQVYIRFEVPGERIEFERNGEQVEGPMSIGNVYTNSMHEKSNLRKLIESWFGKPFPSQEIADEFDYSKLLGRVCMLNVVENESNGRTYTNITSAAPLPRGMPEPEGPENPLIAYDCEAHEESVFADLPKWLREKIANRIIDDENYSQQRPQEKTQTAQSQDAGVPASNPNDFDDDIPF